jgi:type IV pilus assembly protein PilY1
MFYPTDWSGRLTASDLLYNASTKKVTVSTKANWDASCTLTGVPAGKQCLGTGASGVIAAQAPTSRTILTWNGTNGVPFRWASLTPAQQNALDLGDATANTPARLNYLRGDRTNEVNSSGVGLFRGRANVLGDIADSSPTWVGPASNP